MNVYSQFWLFSWQFPLFHTFSWLLVKFRVLFSQKWVFLFCLFHFRANPPVQIHARVSPVTVPCPGCTLSWPTVKALRVYSVYKVAGLGISKKKKEWVELRSSSKLFVTLRVCAKSPSGRLQGTVYSFSFITCHVSHMFTSTLFPYT